MHESRRIPIERRARRRLGLARESAVRDAALILCSAGILLGCAALIVVLAWVTW